MKMSSVDKLLMRLCWAKAKVKTEMFGSHKRESACLFGETSAPVSVGLVVTRFGGRLPWTGIDESVLLITTTVFFACVEFRN